MKKHKMKKQSRSQSNISKFIGYVKKTDTDEIQEIEVSIAKSIEELTYDEVEFAITYEVSARNSADMLSFELQKIAIVDEDDPMLQWPVFREGDPEIKIQKKMSCCKKFLVLPNALYSLTPEYELQMKLVDEGIMSKEDEFDFERMHRVLEYADKLKQTDHQ